MNTLILLGLLGAATTPQIASGMIDYGWSMTPAEVATRSKGDIPEGKGGLWIAFKDYDKNLEYQAGNVGQITIFDKQMETGFYYTDGKLGQIRTYRKEACPDFRTKLKAKFGKPVIESEYSSGYSATWIDAASNTEIRHMASGECRVFFVKID